MNLLGVISATLIAVGAYSIIQAPDYNSPNYAEWHSMGFSNKHARKHFEPYRFDWLPRLI
jgi:hypothetical protein